MVSKDNVSQPAEVLTFLGTAGARVMVSNLDHSADVNAMIEAMTVGGFHKKGILFAPRDALDDDPVVLRYLRTSLEGIEILEEGDLLIINVVRFEPGSSYEHMSAPEAGQLIKELKPKVAILTHFGMTMWRARPWEVANQLSQETGIQVIAARDGLSFDLAELDR